MHVYRIYDAGATLLYVGKSNDVERRVREHRKGKDWGVQIARWTSDEFPDDIATAHEERRLILEEKPLHNRQVPTAVQTENDTVHVHFNVPRPLYEAFAAKALTEYRTVSRQALKLMTEYINEEAA